MPLDTSDELFYWVDENDTVLGQITRKEAHSGSMKLHRSIGILLLNEKNEMLFQKRSEKKDLDGGLWTYAVGGHVEFGKDYAETAQRELYEELGIRASLQFTQKFTYNTGKEFQMAGIFIARIVGVIRFDLDPDEVSEVAWVPLPKIKEFVSTHQCTNWTLEALKKTEYF